jgi:pyruvate formate lyase activating enzyme
VAKSLFFLKAKYRQTYINKLIFRQGMKEAMFYEKIEDNKVHCLLCPHSCNIEDGKRGLCRVRENKAGKLYSLVYGTPCSTAVDPIEKKPLFHFMTGSYTYSIGTAGCNLRCHFCQNWEISQSRPEDIHSVNYSPEQIIQNAIDNECQSISYTYTEPTIFYEYVLDCAKLARKKGLKNIMVTNGFVNQEPIKELYKYIDAVNVDFKSFSDEYYKKICSARLQPVLDAIRTIKHMGIWIELTTLLIPTLNDSEEEIENMCKWIKSEIGKDTVLHFSRFFPCWKLDKLPPTPPETLIKAKQIADKYLNYVYIGNVHLKNTEDTFCPKCKADNIIRSGFSIIQSKLNNNKCFNCGYEIAGVWKK